MSQEFIDGWNAARAVWQRTNSVPPHPPGAPEGLPVPPASESYEEQDVAEVEELEDD